MRAATSNTDTGGEPTKSNNDKKGWLGAKFAQANDGVLLKNVYTDGPAMRAGLSAGDRIIAINNIQAQHKNIYTQFTNLGAEENVTIHAFRRDELMEVQVKLTSAPKTVAFFTQKEDAPADEILRKYSWLESKRISEKT